MVLQAMENKSPPTRKVMVVADPSRESAGALQYALSHVVLENDELILFHIDNPNTWRNTFSFLKRPGMPSNSAEEGSDGNRVGESDFLEEMKQLCEVAQPNIRIRLERVPTEAKDRASAILSNSKSIGVDLLIIGQRRSLYDAILGYRRPGGTGTRGLDTAEYLIENSECTCIGVQKKGQNAGYVLNTKTHKNFWLLA